MQPVKVPPERAPSVACPTCGKQVVWNERAEWRPFCSARCRLIDLGEWLSEEKRIPGEPAAPAENEEPT